MTTTDQQAMTVAHDITRNPGSIWLSPICDDAADHGEGRTWATPAPDETCEDCSEPWVEYVRSDLASVSSASAKGMVDYPAGAIENGREFLRRLGEYDCAAGAISMSTDYQESVRCFEWLSETCAQYANALAASPEPVPATNQAGEVALREACERLLLAMTTRTLRGRDHVPSMRDEQDAASALLAALATQPATSQEGEDLRRALQDGVQVMTPMERVQWIERAKAILAYPANRPASSKDVGALREAAQRVMDEKAPAYHDCTDNGEPQCAWCVIETILAATPTPPTLSEDLRECLLEVSRWFQSINDIPWDEIVADGGVTAWMVIQQEARTVQLPRITAALSSGGVA